MTCTTRIMLPAADSLPFNEHEEQPTDEVALSSRYIEGFVPWIEKKTGGKPAMYLDQHQLHITLVNRTGNRRSPNIGDLAEHFRARLPHTKVWVGELDKMSLVEQVRLFQRTSIFVAVHGAAHTLMMFLPPQAVVVEIMPYKYMPGMQFFKGYTNLARICKKSHILWQNTNATWSEGEGKHATTILSPSAIQEIADASLSRYKANVKAWKQTYMKSEA